ncbi:MAG: HDIG domain-containing protein [Synechococcales bacterium]|nr:HDIG domain-containing protein [Synechococcales bacterium]
MQRLFSFRPVLLLCLMLFSLTAVLGQRFYNQPQLTTGRIAPQTIVAPRQGVVDNLKATEAQRQMARANVAPVMMLDTQAARTVQEQLQYYLEQGQRFRQMAGPFPFVETKLLSAPSQRYLQQATPTDWQAIQQHLARQPTAPRLSPTQQTVLRELKTYKTKAPLKAWQILLERIEQSRQLYRITLKALQDPAQTTPPYQFPPELLQLSPAQWQALPQQLDRIRDRMMTQGIAPGLPPDLLERAIAQQVTVSLPPEVQPIAQGLLQATLQPNLITDASATAQLAEQAAQAIPLQQISIQPGEPIVVAGQPISEPQFLLLEHFQLSQRKTNGWGLASLGGAVALFLALLTHFAQRWQRKWRKRDGTLLWLLMLTTGILLGIRWISHLPLTGLLANLPMVGLLVSSFYGVRLAIVMTVGFALLLPVGMLLPLSQWLPMVVGGTFAAAIGGRLRSREEQALLGLGVGLLQGSSYGLYQFLTGQEAHWLSGIGIQGLGGVLWCVIAIGLSPYLERVFDLAPTVRLLELANPNRPLLKRLAAETPGTFQHTIFVANLAEAAARALDCNVELVRTGTLYHDIGKMHDPQGFIENQMGEPNKHDVIDDPWISAEIIRKHVTLGLKMAQKARLPKAVQAFIPEHQGTMTIAYFHYKALEKAKQNPKLIVEESDFRYAGPAPQSRETGIVMLADACEAALRSLQDTNLDIANNMIQKILRARWQEGQLLHSGLSRQDLDTIAQVFVQVWQQSNHQRIVYPR